MKKLSIEEKAKAYDEAIKVARSKIKNDKNHVLYEEDIIEIFPVIEEERIRKMIINTLNRDKILTEEEAYDCFMWLEKQGQTFTKRDVDDAYLKGICVAKHELEKQGEQKPITNVPTREVILSIWNLGNEWKELTNGTISTEYGTQLDYIQKHWLA